MSSQLDLIREVARAPMRTVRFSHVKGVSANVWRDLDVLVSQGALVRLARGVYTAPPDAQDGRLWTPGLEAAGLALGTARHGDRNAILMGLGAARFWGVIPRAIADTVVAIEAAGHRPVDVSRGRVHFASRDLGRVEASVERTELGLGLVATREQTLFDLLLRPDRGADRAASKEGARNLVSQVSASAFAAIIGRAHRVNASIREVQDRLEARG